MGRGVTGAAVADEGQTFAPPLHVAAPPRRVDKVKCPCGSWHAGQHFVDGVPVPSTLCAMHAHDEWRGRWATDSPKIDPRLPDQRFKPSNVRRIEGLREPVLRALSTRSDLIAPPQRTPPLVTGDNRRDYMPIEDC